MNNDDQKSPSRVPAQPHDRLFRDMLSNSQRAMALLRDHLPKAIAERLTSELRLQDGSFVDEALRGSQADRLFEATLTGDKPLLMYFLFEHKSSPDPNTPLQIAGYMINIWKRYAQDHPDRVHRLPAIIPLVFYHGARTWKVPTSLFEMIDDDEVLRPWTRSMTYLLRDLGRMNSQQVASDPESWAALQAMLLRGGRIKVEMLNEIVNKLKEGSDFENKVMWYIIGSVQISKDIMTEALRQARPKNWGIMMGTLAEQWIEEGIEKGIEKGKVQGLAQGKADTFLRQARLKFGELPEQRIDAVRVATVAQLDQWLDALLVADTLDDIFNTSLSG